MTFIWGNLSKTNSDSTLIDEAIGAAVASHNNNPDAHLGTGQALQSHRAADIIDHLAESVVNDKIRANARTYLAIVDPDGDGDYTTLEDACDYAFTKGSGSIFVKKGMYTPTRDLKLKYGIDIYGEGPNETVVNLSSTTFKSLNVSGSLELGVATIPHLYYYAGVDGMDVDVPEGLDARQLDFCYIALPWSDGLLYESDNANRLYMYQLPDETGELDDVVWTPTVEASTSSPIVHVNGWQWMSGLENGEGLVVFADGAALGTFKQYLGNGDIELVENSINACTHGIGISFQGVTGRMSIIQGVSFSCATNPYIFKVDGTKGRLFVRDAAFMNVGGIFQTDQYYNTQDAQGVVIEDAVFWMNGGQCNFNISGATMRNCTFNFDNYSYPYKMGGPFSYFENCNFYGSYSGVTNKLQSVQRDSRFNGCIFHMMFDGDVVNNGSYSATSPDAYVSFVGCTFVKTTSGSIAFSGNNILVSGCRFYLSNGDVGLKSTTRYSTFTGCQGKGTLLSQPTNCIVTANGFWSSMS